MLRYTKLFLLLLLTTSCGSHFTFHATPIPLPEEEKLIEKPVRVALVLGAGGVRGMAHVGILEELEKAHIPIDLIVGCSAGSLIGALYADTPHAETVKNRLFQLGKKDLLDYSFCKGRFGFIQGNHLRQVLDNSMEGEHFRDLSIKLVVVTTDLITGEEVILSGGEVVPAVHASCAVPLYFRPVQLYGRILVDGGVVNPIPVDIARRYNPDVVVAVDLSEHLPDTFPRHFIGVAKRSLEIVLRNHSWQCVKNADVVIQPYVPNVGLFEDGREEELYEAGKQAAKSVIPRIHQLLQRP